VSKRHEFRAHNAKTATLHPKKQKDFLPVLTTATILAAVKKQDEKRKQSVVLETENAQNQVHPEPEPASKEELGLMPKKTFAIPKTLL